MRLGECNRCHGKGRTEHPFNRAGGTVLCDSCKGTGKAPTSCPNQGGIVWNQDQECDEEVRMGYGLADQVPVPKNRPVHVVFGVAEGPSLGHTYTFEIPVGDILVTYIGVPIEEHDLDNTLYMARLDRALTVSARRE